VRLNAGLEDVCDASAVSFFDRTIGIFV
jgi:hypothetical protein